MNFIVYKTTNKINGRFYIGVHNGVSSNYYGSGRLLKSAIKKYGKENFIRITLYSNLNEEEAFLIESMIVETVDKNPLSYNLEPGGFGNCNLGKSVVKNKIGIHAATFEERSAWSKKNQADRDKDERLKMSSIGGKQAAENGKGWKQYTTDQRLEFAQKANQTKIDNNSYCAFTDPEVQRLNGIKGGKATAGFRTYNDGSTEYKFKSSNTTNKELTEVEFNDFISNNSSFIKGRVFIEHPGSKGIRVYNDGITNLKFKSSNPESKELTNLEFSTFIMNNQNFNSGRVTNIK